MTEITDGPGRGVAGLTADTILVGHTDEATAYVVDDYPYGFRLRTQIRYWIETTKHGDRFVSQTLNPKTDRWNKPKKSTYTDVGFMYIEPGTGHVKWTGVGIYTDDDAVEAFLSVTQEHLSEAQKTQMARLLGTKRAYKHVTYTVREQGTPEEEAAADAEQAKVKAFIARRVAIETITAGNELGVQWDEG